MRVSLMQGRLHTTCPWCGAEHTAYTSMGESEVPDDGSVSLCRECGRFSVFTNTPLGIATRMPTEEEQAEFATAPRLVAIREMWKRHLRQM